MLPTHTESFPRVGDIMARRLTESHQKVLFLLSKGMRNAEMAQILGLKERTIKGYVSQLFLIFDVTNRTELVGLGLILSG
jgi:DNA-binding CsgD family transcriptional regulator